MNGTITKEIIKSMIYEVRGKKVMLASDLAKLFKLETKYINRVVKRNINEFNSSKYFQITKNEYEEIILRSQNESSRCQFGTLNDQKNNRGTNLKYLPYVFTRDGVETLASILKSPKVKVISKEIIEAFEEELSYGIIKEVPEIQVKNVRTMIYDLDGIPIMLDFDLANLYGCKNGAKTINLAVKRNKERFPNKYYFQMTEEEFNKLRFQVETANLNMIRSLPYAFSEQGVYMLATVLRTENAAKISLNIMEAFVLMRHYLEDNNNLILNINNKFNYYDAKLLKHDIELDKHSESINELFNNFKSNEKKELIFMNGEVYDSYSIIMDLLNTAKKDLIIIDGYADKSVLDMISKLKVNVTLMTKQECKLKNIDIDKYNMQYHNLNIIFNNDFHDRFIILDKDIIYHLGTSINYAGSKVFAINKLEEKEIKDVLIKKVNSIL